MVRILYLYPVFELTKRALDVCTLRVRSELLDIELEVRPSVLSANTAERPLRGWAVRRLVVSERVALGIRFSMPDPTSRAWELPPLLRESFVEYLLSTFTSLETVEIRCTEGQSERYRSELLSVLRDVLHGRRRNRRIPEFRMNQVSESVRMSTVELVRDAQRIDAR